MEYELWIELCTQKQRNIQFLIKHAYVHLVCNIDSIFKVITFELMEAIQLPT
jgi:hypothetical protein